MSADETTRLIDRDGQAARLELPDAEGQPTVAVLDSGATVHVPPALMVQEDASTYRLKARFDDLPPEGGAPMDRASERPGRGRGRHGRRQV